MTLKVGLQADHTQTLRTVRFVSGTLVESVKFGEALTRESGMVIPSQAVPEGMEGVET